MCRSSFSREQASSARRYIPAYLFMLLWERGTSFNPFSPQINSLLYAICPFANRLKKCIPLHCFLRQRRTTPSSPTLSYKSDHPTCVVRIFGGRNVDNAWRFHGAITSPFMPVFPSWFRPIRCFLGPTAQTCPDLHSSAVAATISKMEDRGPLAHLASGAPYRRLHQ